MYNKIKAYLRLQDIRKVSDDRKQFTSLIYKAIKNRTPFERSLIIGDLRKMHQLDLEKESRKNELKHLETEKALDVLKFTIIN